MEKSNNKVYLRGEIISDKRFSHEVYGEGFYEVDVAVKRLSGQADILPITVSERMIADGDLDKGKTLSVLGQYRSFAGILG